MENCKQVMESDGTPTMEKGRPVFEKCFCPILNGEQVPPPQPL